MLKALKVPLVFKELKELQEHKAFKEQLVFKVP